MCMLTGPRGTDKPGAHLCSQNTGGRARQLSVYFKPTWSGLLKHPEVYRETQKRKIKRRKNMTDKLGVVAQVCGPRKAQAGGLLQVHGDLGLHRTFSGLPEK